MKDLEKLVKSSFDNFEPEVGSDVWQKLEQGLNNLPASSVSGHGNAVVKGLAIKGSTMAWVASVIVTAAITAAIVFSGNSSNDKKSDKKSIDNGTAETVSLPKNDINTTVTEQVQSQNVESNNNNRPAVSQRAVSYKTTKAAEKINGSGVQPKAVIVNEKNSSKNDEVEDNKKVQSSTKAYSENPENNAAAPQNNVVANSVLPSGNNENNLDQGIPVTIISSGSCGFAPFKVAFLLNDANVKGIWDFGDGNATLSLNTTSHIFKNPGTYVITCKTENTEITQTVEVIGTVSNAFTPNGDGKNDEFFIDAPGIQELLLKVYNRSGHLEYEMTQPGQHWDGKNENGKDLPSGTYFYDIFARSINGQTITQKGTINILR
ncbi:MAG: gliding motility-associated C-terminal domain-containing protein [Bacteroidota bacterium]